MQAHQEVCSAQLARTYFTAIQIIFIQFCISLALLLLRAKERQFT